jgi:predicted transposase/invertase (TIGR01784 family)
MDRAILPPVDDWVFKLLFGDERNKTLLIHLLQALLKLPNEELELTFLDPHLKPEAEDDKLGIIDVKVKTSSGKIINIEIQINPVKDIGKRLSFYKSKLIVEQIKEGDDYRVIQQVITLCITDYVLFPTDQRYLIDFRYCNPETGFCFEAIPETIYTLELPKLPIESDGTPEWNWTQFLRSKTKEEFEMVASRSPEIRQAVNTLYGLSADAVVRAEYEQRMKAWRDRKAAMDGSWEDGKEEGREEGIQKGKEETARNALAEGLPLKVICTITGLTEQQIKEL